MILVAGCSATTGPPTMPLSPGAEVVKIFDAESIKKSSIDLGKCAAVGQLTVGPVEWNNMEVMVKNETFAHGGDVFFGTSWTAGDMTQVTGMAYRCASPVSVRTENRADMKLSRVVRNELGRARAVADEPPETGSRPQDADVPTVHGLRFGATEAETAAKLAFSARTACSGPRDERVCFHVAGHIGDVWTEDDFFFGPKGGLGVVLREFATPDYGAVRAAFNLKFGEASSCKVTEYANLLGARFSFEDCIWIGKTMVVKLNAYKAGWSRERQVGLAEFMPRATYDDDLAAAEAQRKKAQADF